jgi:hypothetical protein
MIQPGAINEAADDVATSGTPTGAVISCSWEHAEMSRRETEGLSWQLSRSRKAMKLAELGTHHGLGTKT